MPFEAYIGYVADRDAEIEAGEAVVIEVRDLDTYERLIVRAVVGKPGAALEGADDLWILDWIEARQKEPWRIRVVEELEEGDPAAAALRSDITPDDLTSQGEISRTYASGRGRGGAMPGTMGEEEARKYYENIQKRKLVGEKP
jgi:hypothetical protein